MNTSVVTVVWNRAPQAYWGLRSILIQDEPPEELLIIDDGSIDNLHEVYDRLVMEFPHIEIVWHYLHHPEARISSFGRNVGLKKARHELVIFTEPEMLHVGNTIKQIKDKIGMHESALPIATQVWTIGPKIQEKFLDKEHQWLERPASILTHPYAELTTSENLQNKKAPDSDWAITGSLDCFVGACFGGRKNLFTSINGFDESMDGYGWEDWDLLHRASAYLSNNGIPPEEGMKKCNDIIVMHQWHRKDYPFNIYEKAEGNGKLSELRQKSGEIRANLDREWGMG